MNACDGVDQAEASTIASAYFLRFINLCGGPGAVFRHGDQWWFSPVIGIGGRSLGATIKVDARTGGVSFNPRAVGLEIYRSRSYESLEDFLARLRWTPIHISLPSNKEERWSEARARRALKVLDDSLRDRDLGEAETERLESEHHLLLGQLPVEVVDVDVGLAFLKNKLIELEAPPSTILYVKGQAITLGNTR